MSLTIAVDLDGVLHDWRNPVEGRTMGAPLPGAVQAMTELMLEGDTLIVFTCRDDSTGYITRWLDYWHVPYHEVTSRKPAADVYLDDKALRHRDWQSSMRALTAMRDVPSGHGDDVGPSGATEDLQA